MTRAPSRRSPRWALAIVLAASIPAAADDLADEADLQFELGADRYRRGEYREALEHFLASNRLVPNRNVLFNIARSYEQLTRYPDAHRYYLQALGSETDAGARANIEAALRRVSPYVAAVRVTTVPPGATLYIDRRDLGPRGVSPRVLAFQPGRVRVMAELEGYEPAAVEGVDLRLGAEAPVVLTLRRILGRVHVDGNVRGAAVRVDDERGEVVGAVPCDLELPPGRHTLHVSADSYRARAEGVDVVARDTRGVTVDLAPVTGSVVVSADERDALVEIDGHPVGFTPAVVDAQVGTRRVRVSRAGFRTIEQTVRVTEGAQSRLDLSLRQVEEVTAASRAAEAVEDAPSSVSIVSGAELRAMAYPTVAEALRGTRGIFLSDDRNYPTVGFRGYSRPGDYGNRVLVLLDGAPMNDSWLNSAYLGYDLRTDLEDLARIEVVRGPGSVLYGTGAFSGVVNLVSRGREGPTGVEGTVSTNQEGVARARVMGRYRANDHAGVSLSVSGARSPGRDIPLPELVGAGFDGTARGVDGFETGTVLGRAWYRALSVQWSLHSRRKDIPAGAYDSVPGLAGTYLVDTRGLLELRFDPRLSDTAQLLTRLSLNHYEYRSILLHTDDPTNPGRETFNGTWLDGEIRGAFEVARGLRLNLGAQGQYHLDATQTSALVRVDRARLPVDFRDSRNFGIAAGYLTAEWAPSEQVRVSGAIRGEYFSTIGQALPAPRLALIVRPYARGNLKLMAGRAFRVPSIYELYYNDGGQTQEAAPGLRPETVWSGEIEFSHRIGSTWTALVSTYANYLDSLIALRESTVTPALIHYENTSVPVLTLGAEAELRREWRQGWMVSASYSFQRSRYVAGGATRPQDALREVPNAPEHLFSVRAAVPVVPELFTLMSRLTVEGPRWDRFDRASDPAQARTDPGVVWDVVLSGRVERWGVRYAVGLYNVFDWRVATPVSGEFDDRLRAMPQLGRSFLFSATVASR
jgi:outer membrane receptor protein involved in Fe transport